MKMVQLTHHPEKNRRNEKGQVVIVILGIMIFFMIFIPTLVYYVQQEAKWTEKQRMTNAAFHLAEAGLDRGYWKLKERSDYWDLLGQGIPISGYYFDRAYQDVPSTGTPLGKYTVSLSSHSSNANWRMIRSVGIDSSNRETRALELILEKNLVNTPLYGPNISFGGNVQIHWGPVLSTQNLQLSGSADRFYPRKYVKGQLTCDTSSHDHYDPNPGGKTSGPTGAEYPEWYTEYDVPEFNVDISSYMTMAQAQGKYYSGNQDFSSVVDTTTWTRYIVGDAKFTGSTFIQGNLIVTGSCEFSGSGDGKSTTTVSSEAWKEYIYGTVDNPTGPEGDTPDDAEYPADKGYHTTNSTFEFGKTGQPNLATHTSDKLTFKGFLYVGGNLTLKGGTVILGKVIVKGTTTSSGGGATLYYDDQVGVSLSEATFSRKSWKEIKLDWPAGL